MRLLICSIDKAEQIGLNWWRSDPRLSTSAAGQIPTAELNARLDRIEKQLTALTEGSPRSAKR
ncbi:hypothetical protein D3C83_177520 [compost metagenome]